MFSLQRANFTLCLCLLRWACTLAAHRAPRYFSCLLTQFTLECTGSFYDLVLPPDTHLYAPSTLSMEHIWLVVSLLWADGRFIYRTTTNHFMEEIITEQSYMWFYPNIPPFIQRAVQQSVCSDQSRRLPPARLKGKKSSSKTERRQTGRVSGDDRTCHSEHPVIMYSWHIGALSADWRLNIA